MNAERFPLSWPIGWTRTPTVDRRGADFQKTRTVVTRDGTGALKETKRTNRINAVEAAERLERQLEALGATYATLSTNLRLRLDGAPAANQVEPYDTGAAVYFQLKNKPIVLACDRFTRTADNIAALANHIDALRRIDRYGVGSLEQAFAGYMALPAQASPWWTVLEFKERPTSYGVVTERHTELAKKHHPDRGGDRDVMAKINAARDAARLDLGV